MTMTERCEVPPQVYTLAQLRVLTDKLDAALCVQSERARAAFLASDIFAPEANREDYVPGEWP